MAASKKIIVLTVLILMFEFLSISGELHLFKFVMINSVPNLMLFVFIFQPSHRILCYLKTILNVSAMFAQKQIICARQMDFALYPGKQLMDLIEFLKGIKLFAGTNFILIDAAETSGEFQ